MATEADKDTNNGGDENDGGAGGPKMVTEAYLKAETKRAFERGQRNARKALIEDESFVTEVSEKHGLRKAADVESAAGTKLDELTKKLNQEFEAKRLTPVQKQLDAALAEVSGMRTAQLDGAIAQAAAKHLNPELLSDASGQFLLNGLRSVFGYDGEHKSFFAKDGEGFAASASGSTPYKGVEEYVREFAASPAGRHFAKATTQQGAGLSPAKGAAPAQTSATADIAAGLAAL